MNKPLHLIYVTGLGDQKISRQRKLVNTWRWSGVEPEVFQVLWSDKELWPSKLGRLLSRIDAAIAEGKEVGLVAVSAGATAAIHAYSVRKDVLTGVVLIAGKVNNPETIGGRYRSENPAFIAAANSCPQALASLSPEDRDRIISRHAIFDEVVPRKHSIIEGAHNSISPTIGHVPTIGLQISFGAPSFIRFLKRQAALRSLNEN